MPSTYYVAWWNLENLFDEENSPRRTEKVARVIKNDIVGWTPQLRDRKVSQLASVIAQMNEGAGPDLLGVCEVENRFVLDLLAEAVQDRLPGREYGIVHADTDDARGIDVAFLFDKSRLEVPDGEVFFHVVMRRNATREIVQVNFRTHRDRIWAVFGNHWPSRGGGAGCWRPRRLGSGTSCGRPPAHPMARSISITSRISSTSSSSTTTWPDATP